MFSAENCYVLFCEGGVNVPAEYRFARHLFRRLGVSCFCSFFMSTYHMNFVQYQLINFIFSCTQTLSHLLNVSRKIYNNIAVQTFTSFAPICMFSILFFRASSLICFASVQNIPSAGFIYTFLVESIR
jgi:hypothetical protein